MQSRRRKRWKSFGFRTSEIFWKVRSAANFRMKLFIRLSVEQCEERFGLRCEPPRASCSNAALTLTVCLMLREVHALVLGRTVVSAAALSALQHGDQRTSIKVALFGQFTCRSENRVYLAAIRLIVFLFFVFKIKGTSNKDL